MWVSKQGALPDKGMVVWKHTLQLQPMLLGFNHNLMHALGAMAANTAPFPPMTLIPHSACTISTVCQTGLVRHFSVTVAT